MFGKYFSADSSTISDISLEKKNNNNQTSCFYPPLSCNFFRKNINVFRKN